MKYTNSHDEVARTSIKVTIRLDKTEIKKLRTYLKKSIPSGICTDKDLRDFVASCVEYYPPSDLDMDAWKAQQGESA